MLGWLVSKLCLVFVSFRDRLKAEGVCVCWNHINWELLSRVRARRLCSLTQRVKVCLVISMCAFSPLPSLPSGFFLNSHYGWACGCICTVHWKTLVFIVKAPVEVICFGHSSHNCLHIFKTSKIAVNLLTDSAFRHSVEKPNSFYYLIFEVILDKNWW